MSVPKTPAEEKAAPISFESGISRLEEIVEQMESDKLPLEDLLLRYEEGLKLVKVCSEKLKAAEARIAVIARDAAGKPVATPFEPEGPPQNPRAAGAGEETGNVSLF
ncbi:MAG: exodeoxyribonuclease VII small subunit [Verrucomicrobiota bacterium]|nr:exodeoxyribonuclease VII small subunit [Verrucomicrobiota bacterium]